MTSASTIASRREQNSVQSKITRWVIAVMMILVVMMKSNMQHFYVLNKWMSFYKLWHARQTKDVEKRKNMMSSRNGVDCLRIPLNLDSHRTIHVLITLMCDTLAKMRK